MQNVKHENKTNVDSIPLGDILYEADAALFLRMSIKTLRNWRYRGGGPRYLKIGGRRSVRYRKSDLDQFLLASLRASSSDLGDAND